MFEVFREAIKLIREKRQLDRDTRRLRVANLDYAALQNIVDTVSNRNVEIEINNVGADGISHILVIRPKQMNQVEYKSFEQRVDEARRMR